MELYLFIVNQQLFICKDVKKRMPSKSICGNRQMNLYPSDNLSPKCECIHTFLMIIGVVSLSL